MTPSPPIKVGEQAECLVLERGPSPDREEDQCTTVILRGLVGGV